MYVEYFTAQVKRHATQERGREGEGRERERERGGGGGGEGEGREEGGGERNINKYIRVHMYNHVHVC